MEPPEPFDTTEVLQKAAAGDKQAADRLMPLVYAQLRAAAEAQLAHERAGHSLQATAMVHDAYVRLVRPRQVPWRSRAHFYAAAAEAMRRILLDHARARARRNARLPIDRLLNADALSDAHSDQIVAVDRALERLESEDPEAAAVVRLRFYAGLGVDQVALALGLSPRTVARLWTYARAMLYRALEQPSPHDEG